MRILVVGPGAIGCLLAARLSRTRHGVLLLARDEPQAATLRAHGIRVDRGARTEVFRVPVAAADAPAPSVPHWAADAALYCVKTCDSAAAFVGSRPYLARRTVVVSCQNGIGNVERFTAAGAEGPVLCCVTGMGGTRLGDGHVAWGGDGETWLAAPAAAQARHAAMIARVLNEAGMKVRRHADARSLVWSKAIVNAAINPIGALFRISNGRILTHAAARSMAFAAAREAQRVAAAAGVGLLFEDAADEVRRVCAATTANRSSMLQDVERGRPTEIRSITGEIVAAGRRLGVPTPVNSRLLARLICIAAPARCRGAVAPGSRRVSAAEETGRCRGSAARRLPV